MVKNKEFFELQKNRLESISKILRFLNTKNGYRIKLVQQAFGFYIDTDAKSGELVLPKDPIIGKYVFEGNEIKYGDKTICFINYMSTFIDEDNNLVRRKVR